MISYHWSFFRLRSGLKNKKPVLTKSQTFPERRDGKSFWKEKKTTGVQTKQKQKNAVIKIPTK